MKRNVSNADRALRILIAMILFGIGYSSYIKGMSIVIAALLIIIGFISFVTGISGFCALYSMLGISTAKN